MNAPSHRMPESLRNRFVTLGYALLVIVAWGSNYPLMKRAFVDMPPLTFSVVRVVGAAVVVAMLMRVRREGALLPPRGERGLLALIGQLQFATVFGLTGIALQFLPAGRTAIVVYSMPVWAALFSCFLGRKTLAWWQLCGMMLSLAGLGLFMDPSVIDWTRPSVAFGFCLVLAAAVLWGLGAALYGLRTWHAPLLSQTFWQLLAAGAILGVAALLLESSRAMQFTPQLAAIVVWNWIVPTAVAIWAWSRLLNRVASTVAGQLLALTPLVGIACSSVMFGEDLPPTFALCITAVVLGSFLVLLPRGMTRTLRREAKRNP